MGRKQTQMSLPVIFILISKISPCLNLGYGNLRLEVFMFNAHRRGKSASDIIRPVPSNAVYILT
jgi:hypothetical protein